MKLNMIERQFLLELLPDKSDYGGMKEIRRAREACALTGEEIRKHGTLKKGTESEYLISPNIMSTVIADIPLGEWVTETVRDVLRKKNDKRELEDKYMSLYEKFIVMYQQY